MCFSDQVVEKIFGLEWKTVHQIRQNVSFEIFINVFFSSLLYLIIFYFRSLEPRVGEKTKRERVEEEVQDDV